MEQEQTHCEQLQREVEELRKYKEEHVTVEKETLRYSNSSSTQTCSTSTAANLENGIKNEGESNERPVEGENSAVQAK